MGKLGGFAALCVIVVVIVAAYGYVLTRVMASSDERALFGESFGALIAFFTALAFAAVIYTISLQTRELASQQADAIATRAELAKTARLNALSILAQTYSNSLEWLEQQGKHREMAVVSRLHGRVITEVERLCGIEDGIYSNEPEPSPAAD